MSFVAAFVVFVCACDSVVQTHVSAAHEDQDNDANLDCKTSEMCQEDCNAVRDCVAVRYHGVDKHCHTLVGTVAPTASQFVQYSKHAPDYVSCYLANQ